MANWISVGERLPPLGEDVLLICGDPEFLTKHFGPLALAPRPTVVVKGEQACPQA